MLAFAIVAPATLAGPKDDVGYTQLANELGTALPTGAGIEVSQVEAYEGGTKYSPNPSNSQFTSAPISFVWETAQSATSNHATTVGQYFYGSSTSLSPGAKTVHSYSADDWLDKINDTTSARILNHSWIGSDAGTVLKDVDLAAHTQGLLVFAGLNNGTGVVPELLAPAYNIISVGRSDGIHSRGGTTVEGSGRIKPELVAPGSATSYTTPFVAGAATMLYEHATPNGRKPQALKAILMAGATKEEFPGWSQTSTIPLDTIFGAGELNVYNSYHILNSGEQTTATVLPQQGWDFAASPEPGEQRVYYFSVPAKQVMTDLSAVLTWHRIIQKFDGERLSIYSETLADFQLQLYTRSGSTLGSVLRSCNSSVDNVEHIWEPAALPPGEYALVVSLASDTTNTADYGLAWRSRIGFPTTYQSWKPLAFSGTSIPTADQIETADADGDGDDNLLEYGTGSNAANPNQRANISTSSDGTYFQLTYVRRMSATDLSYDVGVSTDLLSWDYSGVQIVQVSDHDLGDDLKEITVRLNLPISTIGTAFLRLRVIKGM